MQRRYTPLTNNQWKVIKQFLNWKRKRKLSLRRVFDAILYLTRTGCQWRNLSQTRFPAWNAVYYYFRQWSLNGTLDEINLSLNQLERGVLGRNPLPSLALVDSQSIKLAPMIFEHRGVDGNKKVNGRKRHILTDVLGRIYGVHLHAANRHDSPQGIHLLKDIKKKISTLEKVLADKTYRGTFAKATRAIGLAFEVPARAKEQVGFVVEKKRWVVERSFAWMNFYRRVAMDWEHTVQSSAAFIILANISMVIEKI
jgi:transposase